LLAYIVIQQKLPEKNRPILMFTRSLVSVSLNFCYHVQQKTADSAISLPFSRLYFKNFRPLDAIKSSAPRTNRNLLTSVSIW